VPTIEITFWVACGFVVYTYVGYPIGIWCISRLRAEVLTDPSTRVDWPAVTVVIAVHNEQQHIVRKIENLRALDYPKDFLHFVFVSDGSNDATNELITREPDIRLLSYPQRRGKPHALNCALEVVHTPIVVFADVRQHIAASALRYLVARLLHPGTGAVSGELVHREPKSHAAKHIGLYWRYEKWIRKAEGRLASTLGATGALYAMNRADFKPLPPDTLLDDFEIPMRVVRKKQQIAFESRAQIFDELQQDTAGERKRKIRTLTGNFQSCVRNPWLFSPANPLLIQFLSHKVFRLLMPYALTVLFLSAAAGAAMELGSHYAGAAIAQVIFYLLAIAGMLSRRLSDNRLVSFAMVFVELNWTAVLALKKFATDRADPRWQKDLNPSAASTLDAE
jgi:cellulose synthase/poly-beta-1,6-N-acetylglucosamine synthase-like glycosyltransferase